jgi:PAS domain S-box-containing protein
VAFGSLAFFLTLLFIAGRIELERIRADTVLLESERRFEDVAANSGEWIWETDAQGKYTYASPVVERVIGYTPEEVTGKYFHEFLIPAERDAVKEKVAGAFSQKQSFVNLPTRKVHKKGHIVETETSGVPFVDKEGALLGYRGAVQDVTERKLAVEALKKKTELIQLLQEITVAANEASTAEEAMFTCIKKVCAYTGWDIGHVYLPDSEGTLIPTDIWSINDRGRFESFREVSMGITFAPGVGLPGRVYKSGEPAWIMDVTVDLNFLRVRIAKKVGLKTGLAFPVLERKKIAAVLTFFTVEIKKPDESLLDAVALLATQLGRVTERKRAEEALRESEERFRSVAQTANDAIISSDREGKIISWNKGARRMFGYQEEETVGEPLTILMPEKYRQAHQTGLDRFLSTGEAKFIGKTMELKGLRKNGSEFSLDFSLSSWEIGKKTFFTAIIRDITDRILGEEELRQAKDKAEKATQLKDRFLSRAAHDLRAPVGSILGLLQIIENPDTDALHRKKLTGRAIIRCNGMLDMIAEMLNINMFKAGEINPEKVFTQMRILAETATEKLHYAAGEKDIKLVNNIAEGVRIYVDKQLIEGVLQNLISNAIKFSPRGGVVTLSTPESERMTIAVKDAGVGIGKDFLENIFDHNVKTTTLGTAGEKGTGLGMPISKDIVEAHGGSLTVETVEGDGSVFYMALPTVRPKILIVEDDPDYRFILKEILKEVDADIIEADDGGSAIKAMENNTPNMIITDCEMPGMNGFEFIEWIRNDERAKSVPIIVVTHRTDQEALTRALGAGANDFFTKAIVKEDFMKCIRRYIK